MQKRKSAEPGSKCNVMPVEQGFTKRYPTIVMYMTDLVWDDGTPREVSSLGVSVKDGLMCLALNDKDGRQSAYTSAVTLEKALEALEKALAEDAVTWRAWDRKKK